MSDEQKYHIQGLDEYIRQGEPQQRERSEAWKGAIGLQQVDRLQTSDYLLDTAKRHIEGDISIGEAKELIDSYYKSVSGRKEIENDRTEEADKVAALTRFCANLWQIHAFCEGNTRTTAVFMIKYLRALGFNVVNDVFAENSWYFRNALVRANYSDLQSAKTEVKSAKISEELPPKCKNCTLEEVAVLRIVQKNRYATQKEIAAEIGKSERTVKSITIALQDKQVLKRVNGKRNGYWEIEE